MTIWKNCTADLYYNDDTPELRDPGVQAAVVRKLQRGIVVSHGKNRRQVADSAKHYRQYFEEFAFVWTGEISATPKFLL